MTIQDLREAVIEFDDLNIRYANASNYGAEKDVEIIELKKQIEVLSRPTPPQPEGWKTLLVEDCGKGVLNRVGVYAKHEDWNSTSNNKDHVWSAKQVREGDDTLQIHVNRKSDEVVQGGAFGWYAASVDGPVRFTVRARIPKRSAGHSLGIMVWGAGNETKINGSGQWPRFGEFNLAEFFASAAATRAQANLHSNPGKATDWKAKAVNFNADFTIWHTFTCEFTDEKIEYLLDGVPYFTFTDKSHWPEDGKKSIVIQSDGPRWSNISQDSKDAALAGVSLIEIDYLKAEIPV